MDVRHLQGSIQFRNGLKPNNSEPSLRFEHSRVQGFLFLYKVFEPVHVINQIAEFNLGMDYKHP